MFYGLTSTFWIFGNGLGTAAPGFSTTFYWLVDQHTDRGQFYHWIGGFGAQINSFEWRKPTPGTRRRLVGVEFEPVQAHRRWFKWRISWRLVNMPKGREAQLDAIREAEQRIERGW